ncbi:response regulator [Polaribacter sp. M15]
MTDNDNINLKGKKVLVVDDSMMNRMVVSVILNDLGVIVSEAEDGEQAISFLENNASDLILMDLKMPVLNGFQATEIIRQKMNLKTPIIALTANSVQEEKEKCIALGMNHYLSKPYDRDVFIDMVYNYIL